jgi:hypothetical protein
MKNITYNAPKGMILDLELSDIEKGKVVYKEIQTKITLESINASLFDNKPNFCTNGKGIFECISNFDNNIMLRAKTKAQIASLYNRNNLMNVAKFLNGDWGPDFDNMKQNRYFIYISNGQLRIDNRLLINFGAVYFKNKDLAEKAIEILGKENIISALTSNY